MLIEGRGLELGEKNVFGGQSIMACIKAACMVPNCKCTWVHSVAAYFLFLLARFSLRSMKRLSFLGMGVVTSMSDRVADSTLPLPHCVARRPSNNGHFFASSLHLAAQPVSIHRRSIQYHDRRGGH